jgi:hypothetical protein
MVLFLAGIATAATNVGGSSDYEPPPISTDEGGPDDYGYVWVDNDGGGGPEYNWIDITGIGEEVTGLADDNNVGPFPMGFDFPYYWYTVDHCWIGSNGYLSFSSNANHAHPFHDIPDSRQPNDLVAVLTGDLDFTQGDPSCYYYTNNADTFIVSWINVREFALPQTHHTFQVIFSAADSSILFQYGETEGSFSGTDVIGIEDVVGRVGLEYLRNNSPQSQMWHEGLALKFHPEPDPNFVFHDFGIVGGFNESSGAEFIPNNQPYTVKALVKNFGTEPEDNLSVRGRIYLSGPDYNDTVYVDHLEPGESRWVEFDDLFTPSEVGVFSVTFFADASRDENASNDTKICELDSYELPQELQYCDETAEEGRAWNGDFSGFAVEFEIPEAIEVTSAAFNVNSVTTAGPAYVWVLPDDGTGNPDEANPLAGDTVTVTSPGWVNINFSSADLTFQANEKFFVVVIHANQSTFWFGMDNDPPLSNRGWEYTGGLAPDRDREASDIMIRITAEEGVTGIDDDEVTPKSFTISQNYPNPFNARTNISFSIDSEADVSIGIYNIAGQRVADLSSHFGAGENLVSWDASDVATGIYFYRIEYNNASETRKMVLLK